MPVLMVGLVVTLDAEKAIVTPSEEGFTIVVVGDFFQIRNSTERRQCQIAE